LSKKLRYLVVAALLAALTAALVALHFPVGPGFVHLGDAVVLLAGCLLPTPYAMAAAAIGSGMGDWMTGYTIWIPATVILKAAVAALFSARQDRLLTRRNALMVLPYAAVTLAGYALYKLLFISLGLMDGGGPAWTILAVSVGGDCVQVLGSAAVFVLLGLAMDRAGVKRRVGL